VLIFHHRTPSISNVVLRELTPLAIPSQRAAIASGTANSTIHADHLRLGCLTEPAHVAPRAIREMIAESR